MTCYVYRSSRKQDTYLYLPVKDDFSSLPDALMNVFGAPVFALEFELTPQRRLAREDAAQVMENLRIRGFHLQMPVENQTPA
ncbi:YcgL domain-containing protein [Ectothiorhodospira lacustris]|uniref:YcgL domain-containing protein n=1 Tax=Ectothiorhodospira lacustris TaxID=2899127 RepID=UPI001EE7B7B1|nr:YcgL domain-containing protein [Ectothiorhodospira lacustris]MCG5501637.1 YcgL domain-containing protein [Ectothiorhodospira lacustris]MCG5510739.1 YcgL domain-containing protein [Ectothiorhodospira lacustris]MCG5522471.1 YcgL domain-containing protein [Ectothiorhodospira lacustris]